MLFLDDRGNLDDVTDLRRTGQETSVIDHDTVRSSRVAVPIRILHPEVAPVRRVEGDDAVGDHGLALEGRALAAALALRDGHQEWCATV